MAFDKTMFFLMAMYEHPIVPVSKLRKDFFQNLSLAEFVRKLKAGDIAMPMIEMGGDEFSPYGIHVQDVAEYIDALRAEGKAAYERGDLRGSNDAPLMPAKRADVPYTPETLADEWQVSSQRVRDLVKRGELPHFRVGRFFRISVAAARQYENDRMIGGQISSPVARGAQRSSAQDALRARKLRQIEEGNARKK